MKDNKRYSKPEESKYEFDIDYDIFTTDEIVKIYNFYGMVIKFNHGSKMYSKSQILEGYNEYRRIINSIMIEKRYDKKFEEKTGKSIYKTIKEIKEKNK